MQRQATFRVADCGRYWQVSVLRQARFDYDQPKPAPGRLLRHLGRSAGVSIPVSATTLG
jgi:hypothetical protein